MKLANFYNLVKCELCGDVNGRAMSLSNLDDVFVLASKYGVSEVQVTRSEMLMIMQWFLANSQHDKNGDQAKVIKEGKIDKFFGVNLIEI